MKKIWQWIANILIALDRFANAILLGSPEMTLSGRMGRDLAKGECMLCKPICWMLNKIQPGHCAGAAKHESGLGSDSVSQE